MTGDRAEAGESARQRLLQRVLDGVAGGGLADPSLRELAEAAGTSHRMLIYHFTNRDGLVAAIVADVERRQRDVLDRLAADAAATAGAGHADLVADTIRRQWAVLSDPSMVPFVRLFFEVVSMAMRGRPGTEGFLERMTEPWIDAAAVAARAIGVEFDRAEALLGIAVMRGLLLETATGTPVADAAAALEKFLAYRR